MTRKTILVTGGAGFIGSHGAFHTSSILETPWR
jgi:UDP-glucose 4-epimerase